MVTVETIIAKGDGRDLSLNDRVRIVDAVKYMSHLEYSLFAGETDEQKKNPDTLLLAGDPSSILGAYQKITARGYLIKRTKIIRK